MAALWYRYRAELRRGWRGPVVLGVVAGIAAAAVLAAAAGARRTDTAYERMLVSTDAADFTIRAGTSVTAPFDPARVAALPGVAATGEVQRYYLTTPGPRATLGERTPVLASGSVGGDAFFELGRPKVLEGRLPNPKRPDEILVSRVLEREGGFHVGDTSRLVLAVPDPTAPDGIRAQPVRFRIVGVGVTPDQIATDERRQGGLQMLLTPAFVREHPDDGVEWSMQVRLRPGADARAFPARVRALAPDAAIDVASGSADAERVDRATRPEVLALWVFAAVLAVAVLLVLAQSMSRQLTLDAVDDGTLRAIGISRRQRFVLGLLRATPVALLAALVGVVGAIAMSPLLPFGPARVADPDPGLDVDVAVLLCGGLVVAVAVLGVAAIPAWRLARRRDPAAAGSGNAGRSRLATRLAEVGAPPTMVAGTRFALEPGRGPTAVPTRSSLVGITIATTAAVAAVVVAANLSHIVHTPSTWGATWDVTVSVAADARELGAEFDPATVLAAKEATVRDRLDAARFVEGWSVAAAASVELDGRAVPSLGVDVRRARPRIAPAVVDGRLPRASDEVALGSRTADELGVGIGDSIDDTDGHAVRVVGLSVLPRFQTIGGADEAALDRGAVFTLDGVLERSPDFLSRSYLVRVDPAAAHPVRRLRAAIPEPFAFNIERVAAPEDIEALERVLAAPAVLAAVLLALALATLAHALVTSVRRRRRDLAILVTLGFTRREILAQVSATVAWQASVVAIAALVVALPVGIVLGRAAARLFADGIGAVPDLVVPVGVLALLVPLALLVANLVAFVPGRVAGRTRPAIVLRSE